MECQESVQFEICVRAGYAAVVLDLNGDFDLSEVETFRACMDGVIASCDGAVVVDLADVPFIDSTAISALLIARRTLAADGRELSLRHGSSRWPAWRTSSPRPTRPTRPQARPVRSDAQLMTTRSLAARPNVSGE